MSLPVPLVSTNKPKPRLELICIGTELLSGRVNTHQSYLSLALLKNGLTLAKESSLPDNQRFISDEIASALKRCDALIICGGLGPTFDDITREAAAAALGRELIYLPRLYASIKKKFARYRFPVPEENKRQAYVLEGAKVLENKRGSAPGQMLVIQRPRILPQTLVLLPGPFAELSPIFEAEVLPHLKKTYAKGIFVDFMSLHMSGIPESLADEKLQSVIAQAGPKLDLTILASTGQVDFFAKATASNLKEARTAISRVRSQAYQAVGKYIFGEGGDTLEAAVGKRLAARKMTLAVAESCTGGLLGQRLTAVAGSSLYFKGGIVSYSNDLKTRLLNVSAETLARHGAVSAQCAGEMARGVREIAQSNLGLSITGIAGPGGATKSKPLGRVFIAISSPKGERKWRFQFIGDRDMIRQRAATAALHLLLKTLS